MKKKPVPPRRPPPPPPVPAAGSQPGGSVIGLVGSVGRYLPPSPQVPPAHKAPPVHKKPVPHKKPAAHKKPVKRKLALGEAVACCAAEALAASLRLTGWRVTDADVLALYQLTAGGPDEGATILATLETASASGLGGYPGVLAEELHERDGIWVHPAAGLDLDQALAFVERRPVSIQRERNPARELPDGQFRLGHALILGLTLPDGPHAVCDDGTAWWSWGQPYDPADFPLAVIEEAWQVTW